MTMMIFRKMRNRRAIYSLGPWAARLPFYHCGISCGRGSELFDVSRTYFDLASYCGTSRESTYLVQAQGDSMMPVIEDGDLMVVDRDREPLNGDIVLACVDNGDVVAKYYHINKEAGEIRLTPANKNYPERILKTEEHHVACLGVVRYVIRNICGKPKLNILKMSATPTMPVPTNDNAGIAAFDVKSPLKVRGRAAIKQAASTAALKVQINKEALAQWFKAQFKGAGGNPDFFSQNLMEDLGLEWTDRQIGIIANMIYESGWLAGRPDTFKAWYSQFCLLIGRNCHTNYRPSKLIPTEGLKRRFYYLKKE